MNTPTPRTDAYEYDAGWAAARYGERWKPMDFARALETELTVEREKVKLLRSALENLADEQNGAPLETRRDEWQAAMDEACDALAATQGAK